MSGRTSLCCRKLWVLLSEKYTIKSTEYINLILEDNSEKIVKGLLYYDRDEKDKRDTKDILKAHDMTDIPARFIERLGQLINLDIVKCCELFINYLLHEYRGTPKSVKNLFTNESSVQELLHGLWDFYYTERLFALFCCKQILSNWHESSQHPYRELFYKFLSEKNVSNDLVRNVITQLTQRFQAKIPERNSHGHSMTPNLIEKWIQSNIRETYELLQILLLYFRHLDPTVDQVRELVELFNENYFGTRLSFARDIGLVIRTKSEQFLKLIGFFEALIIIECLQLDWFYKCIEQEMNKHFMLIGNEKVRALDRSMVENMVNIQQYSPLIFAWMLVKSFATETTEVEDNRSLVKRLGKVAISLDVFGYLVECLSCELLKDYNNSSLSSVVKKVIGDLVGLAFTVYSFDLNPGGSEVVFELLSLIADNDDVARTVFQQTSLNGLWSIYANSFSSFPRELNCFMNISLSLVKTSMADNFLSLLGQIDCFCEKLTPQIVNNCVPKAKDYYVLRRDREIYSGSGIFISSNTEGKIFVDKNNQQIIKWNFNSDGLKVLTIIFQECVNSLYLGSASNFTDISIHEITKLITIVAKIVRKDVNLFEKIGPLLEQIFNGFRLFSKFPRPPRLFIASCIEVFSCLLVSNRSYSSYIWEMISECALFPYMIGLTKKEIELITGQDTNSSRIGEMIASEECIQGRYELCRAYLDLLANSLPADDQVCSAALIHISSEIFSSFFHWHFQSVTDQKVIGLRCLEIFNNILSMKPEQVKKRTHLMEITKTALLCGPAGQTLLNIVVTGQEIVGQAIEANGGDTILLGDDLINMIRLALIVLNNLLRLQKGKRKSGGIGGKLRDTSVEQALFSTSSTKSNMVLVLSQYIFQKYDSRLTTLAVTLLKRLSKHFPMSMLACLGSEAESIRDHFLYRLEGITEDLKLKIALLSFLSSCIKHQPGLIEMFLNLGGNGDGNSSAKGVIVNNSALGSSSSSAAGDGSTCSCLRTVLEILEEKMNDKYYCPYELHLAAVKFITTFWLQPHLLAIDSLKKTANLWELICFPLKEMKTFDDKIFGHILRLLAREVFYSKSLERNEFDKKLVEIFNHINEGEHLTKISAVIREHCSKPIAEKSGAILLLCGWRDFLLSISKFEPFKPGAKKKQLIMDDLLTNLSYQLEMVTVNHSVLIILSDILMMLLRRWSEDGISSIEKWLKTSTAIIYAVNQHKEILEIGFLINVSTMLSYVLKIFEQKGQVEMYGELKDWATPWCGLFRFCFRILEKKIPVGSSSESEENHFKLCIVVLGVFEHIITAGDCRSQWLPIVRKNLILESILSLLCVSIECRKGLRLAQMIISTLIHLSSIPDTANLLQTIGLIEEIECSLKKAKMADDPSFAKIFPWLKAFEWTIKLTTSMMLSLGHHFVQTAIDFVVNNLFEVTSCLTAIRTSPVSEKVDEASHMTSLLIELTYFKQFWINYNRESFECLVDEMSKTCNSLISFVLRPGLLQHLLMSPSFPVSTAVATGQGSKMIDLRAEPGSSVKLTSIETDQINLDVHQSLFKLITKMLVFLNNIGPNVLEVMSMINLDRVEKPALRVDVNLGAPNIDPNKTISFGSLLNCISLCMRMYLKSEKSGGGGGDESGKDNEQLRKQTLFTLEISLSLLVSQAISVQMSPVSVINEREKQVIGRELKTELNSMLSTMSRQSKRNLSGSNLMATRLSSSCLIERPYISTLMGLLDSVFK